MIIYYNLAKFFSINSWFTFFFTFFQNLLFIIKILLCFNMFLLHILLLKIILSSDHSSNKINCNQFWFNKINKNEIIFNNIFIIFIFLTQIIAKILFIIRFSLNGLCFLIGFGKYIYYSIFWLNDVWIGTSLRIYYFSYKNIQ
jgi:hypothetical protein